MFFYGDEAENYKESAETVDMNLRNCIESSINYAIDVLEECWRNDVVG